MLCSLRIENFAIVKLLDLDLNQGMTAFTGETGAGKSIMIDALMLALGGRGDATVVRYGEEKCDISAVFSIDKDEEPAIWLKEQDIEFTEGELILRRVITSEGRSKAYINGQPFPLQKVKELAEMLVHIHGQHQHQKLLEHSTHRQQLDNYASLDKELGDVQQEYKNCQKIKTALEELTQFNSEKDKIDLLRFQIDELVALDLQEGELQVLHEEHQLLHHARNYIENANAVEQLLNQDGEQNVVSNLNYIVQILRSLPQNNLRIKNLQELIHNALIQIEEAADEIQAFSSELQLDPERLQEIELRMSKLHQMGRKYHLDPNLLNEHMAQLESQLNLLQNSELKIKELEASYQTSLKAYKSKAIALREARAKQAPKLAAELTAIIQKLGMPKGKIEVELSPLDKMQTHGLDRIEYKVCTNPGMLPDSLAKIASGGELSRISLAIQMTVAEKGSTPTLLFDEVDVGIGGATAALVGQFLRKLGGRLQVFCVTHQPQVAAAAHNHFIVEKYSDNEQTFSQITSLVEKEKINEIARMLGGLTITEQTLSHAKELLAEHV